MVVIWRKENIAMSGLATMVVGKLVISRLFDDKYSEMYLIMPYIRF